jgi:N-acetyl-alpha-D-muramate 1-phosphate uridylyltransferase
MSKQMQNIIPKGTKAMIFAAGLGTRFKPWTDAHPKALAPVNGKTLLQRNIEYLSQYGISDVVVNVHHFADQLTSAIITNKGWGSQILISDESEQVLETGGGLMKAKDYLEGDKPFFTINADILTDLDLNKLYRNHLDKKPLISFAITNRTTSRYLLFNKDLRLCGWRNENSGEERISISGADYRKFAYSCVVIFEPKIFSLIKQTGKFSLIDVYLDLAANNLIIGYDHSGDILVDVGKPESINVAEKLFP